MGATALVTVAEFLNSPLKPYPEYLDGVIRQKPMPTKLHGLLQFLILMELRKLGWDAIPEMLVRLTATRFLVPDVVADRHLEDPYPTRPVALCIEILSPGDRFSDTLAKCEEYRAWGVPFCWIIDPQREICWEYEREVPQGRALQAGEIQLDPVALFAEARRLL